MGVKRRTGELSNLATQLQALAEQERAGLSRELHDELGGLLVAARMDISWLQGRLADGDADVQAHFKRLHDSLRAAVDITRRIVERQRPVLLDNLGLIAALRWQVAAACERSGAHWREHYPGAEPNLTPEASITMFRIVQEALAYALEQAQARNVEVALETQGKSLIIRVRDDGSHTPQISDLSSTRHRTLALGGRWRMNRAAGGGGEIEARLPSARVLAAQPAQPM